MSPGSKGVRIARLLSTRALPALALSVGVRRLRRPDIAIPLLGLAAWTVSEAINEDEDSNRQARSSSQDEGTRHLVLGAHLASWWLPTAALLVRGGQQRVSAARTGSAAVLLLAGAALRIAAVRELGRSFTAHVQVDDQQELCRSGPYAVVRHPSYIGLFLLNIAPAVAIGGTAPLVAGALTAYANTKRVAVEERALTELLGDSYADYAKEVPRWLPTLVHRRRRGLAMKTGEEGLIV